jgi:Zn-dependent protease
MFRPIFLGRPLGIPLYIHPTWLLVPVWVLLSHPAAGLATSAVLLLAVVAVFACVVLHELGHAFAARHYGIPTRDITLYPIGGVARLECMSERPKEELVIALAGPAVNLVIALLLTPAVLLAFVLLPGMGLNFTPASGPVVVVLEFLTVVWGANIVLLVFNLIPCFPMDGGRVFRALLSLGMGRLRATEVAAAVGLVIAAVIGGLALRRGDWMMVVLALFVALAGQVELRALRAQQARPRPAGMGPVAEPVLVTPPVVLPGNGPPPAELTADFSGYTWHPQRGTWVLWDNGRPVAFWGPAE